MTNKSGFVTVVGRPNVGKSTLVNKLIGEKITITSPRPQTTRHKINTIYTSDRGQIIFVDTPGIHKSKNELDEYMLKQAYKSLEGIDMIIFLVDGTTPFGAGDNFVYKQIKNVDLPIISVMNKIDQLDHNQLIQRKNNYEKNTEAEVIPISATQKKNFDTLLDMVFEKLPEGPQYYPEDMITDQIERSIVAEIIREKIFYFTRDEVPYGVAVIIEEMKERDNGMYYVRANLYVEQKSHKGIIIGKNGKRLRKIGKEARKDIEDLLKTQTYLDLWVKVEKNWRDKEYLVKRMGYKE